MADRLSGKRTAEGDTERELILQARPGPCSGPPPGPPCLHVCLSFIVEIRGCLSAGDGTRKLFLGGWVREV